MDTKSIGQIIAELRKEKGVKQEELASYLNVSAQAVSKWENGGTPDIEHIPAIADFFGVTTDEIFGRGKVSGSGLAQAITATIRSEKLENQVEKSFEICSMAEAGLFGEIGPLIYEESDSNREVYSQMSTNNGFTDMCIGSKIRYFFAVPEIKEKNLALLDNIDYLSLFGELSKKDVFDSLIYILKRKDLRKQFTNRLISRELNLSPERASEILCILRKYSLLYADTLEIDDCDETVYTVATSGAIAFVSMLIFAHNMIERPCIFYYYNGGRTTALL
jgi:transcriptional regulator with XRE-family HTH domain